MIRDEGDPTVYSDEGVPKIMYMMRIEFLRDQYEKYNPDDTWRGEVNCRSWIQKRIARLELTNLLMGVEE